MANDNCVTGPHVSCFTWKNATYALAGILLAAISYAAWAQANYASVDDVKEVKEILVRCLIEKKC